MVVGFFFPSSDFPEFRLIASFKIRCETILGIVFDWAILIVRHQNDLPFHRPSKTDY